MKINNLREAKETFEASGFYGWDWFDGYDEDELIEYIFRNSDDKKALEMRLWFCFRI